MNDFSLNIYIDKKLSKNRLTQRKPWIVSSFWNVSFRLFLEEQESGKQRCSFKLKLQKAEM